MEPEQVQLFRVKMDTQVSQFDSWITSKLHYDKEFGIYIEMITDDNFGDDGIRTMSNTLKANTTLTSLVLDSKEE